MLPRLPRPKPTVIETSVEIDAPVRNVFRFHLDTRNAPRISPPETRILSVDGTFPVTEGSEVRLKVRQMPLPRPAEWHIRIDTVVPNEVLVDVALSAPFPFVTWRHEHRFESLGRDRTRMTDRIAYTLPYGPLGGLVDRMLVQRMLRESFAQRHLNTKTLMENT